MIKNYKLAEPSNNVERVNFDSHKSSFFIINLWFNFIFMCRCLQNYIPPQSLTLSCPVCRQTSILPEKGVAALQNNFFITNLMEVLQRDPECSRPEACNVLESASAATACQPLSCPNHEGKVRVVFSTQMTAWNMSSFQPVFKFKTYFPK